jgi:hypothetical protein
MNVPKWMAGRGTVGRFPAGRYPAAAHPSPELQGMEPPQVANHDRDAISMKIECASPDGAIRE